MSIDERYSTCQTTLEILGALRRSLPALTLSIAVLLFANTSCGGSSPSSSTTEKSTPTPSKAVQYTAVDACTLVQASDATAAVGGTEMVAATTGAAAGQQSLCIYGPKDSSSSSQAGVFVLAVVYPDQSTADAVSPEQLAAAYQVTGVANAKVVNGIGDKAVEYTATTQSGGGMAIFVFRRNVLLMIAVSPSGDSTKMETLARVAVSNLDKSKS